MLSILAHPGAERLQPALPRLENADLFDTEAIEELEFAHAHGLKVAMIPPGVARPIPSLDPSAFPAASYLVSGSL